MNSCISACKQIVMLCEEAHARGKNIIRINKIVDIADKAVMEELDNHWHTGTPTEEGDYFVAYHWGLDNKIMHDMASRILYGATTFENGNWKIDYPYVVIAWQKIEPYNGA